MNKYQMKDSLGRVVWNYKELEKLSPEEFARLYVKEMGKSIEWDSDILPKCTKCHKEIEGPKEMRKYGGRTLHPDCFLEVFRDDKYPDPHNKRYFEMVAEMKVDF
jgi:hypothetical protein